MLKTVAIALTMASTNPAPSVDEINHSVLSDAQPIEIKENQPVSLSNEVKSVKNDTTNDLIANKKYKPRGGLIMFPHGKDTQTLDNQIIANKKYKPRGGLIMFPHGKVGLA